MKPHTLFFALLLLAVRVTAQDPIAAANKCYDDKNYQCANEQYLKALDTKQYQEKDHAMILVRIGYGLGTLNKRDDATRYFMDAIALDPNYGNAYWSMAGNYFYLNQFQKAIDNYTKAIDLYKNDNANLKTLYYWRGRSYVGQEENESALTDFESAISIDSSVAGYFAYAADAAYNTEDYELAITYYTKSIELGDADKKVISARYYWLGQSNLQMYEYDDALTAYKKAVDFNPENKEAQWEVAATYNSLEKWSESIAEYTRAIGMYRNDTVSLKNLYYYRADDYSKLKQYDKAMADYDAILKIDPDYRNAVWQKSDILNSQKKYKEAITSYTRTIQLFKGDNDHLDDIYYFRGYCYLQLKDTANAKADFLQSIAFNGKLRDPNIQMGNISFGAKKYYDAKDYYNTGITGFTADSSELSVIYFRKGFSNINSGDTYFYTGRSDLKRSIDFDSTNKEAHRYLADAYYRQSLFPDAENELNKCVRLYKNIKDSIPNIYTYRALPRWQQRNYKGALEDYEQADKLKKYTSPDNIKSMAQLAFEIKDYVKSISIFTRLMTMYKPDQKDELMFAYYGRGRSAFELKQKQAAVNDLSKAIELTPGNKDVQEWLDKAKAL